MIDTTFYPQLTSLMWNMTSREIKERDAFALYENNWHRVDIQNLSSTEKKLIKSLIQAYANGVFMGRNFRESDLHE